FQYGIRFDLTRQTFLNFQRRVSHEAWLGRRYDTGADINAPRSAQVLRWLQLNGVFFASRDIFYDRVNPFQGQSKGGSFGFTLQPDQHFQQSVDYNTVRFERASDGS